MSYYSGFLISGRAALNTLDHPPLIHNFVKSGPEEEGLLYSVGDGHS